MQRMCSFTLNSRQKVVLETSRAALQPSLLLALAKSPTDKQDPKFAGGPGGSRGRQSIHKACWSSGYSLAPSGLLTGCTKTLFLPYKRVAREFWCSDST